MGVRFGWSGAFVAAALLPAGAAPGDAVAGAKPVRSETVQPARNASFNKGGAAKVRKQGGNPRAVGALLVFDGAQDGDRQVDPQLAVGGGHVLHATNGGLTVYDKQGNYVAGVPQAAFKGGIDPKLLFDPHNQVFMFDLWVYWDKEKKKPVNVSVSEAANPLGAWNTYSIFAPAGVDGGAIGQSRRWIGYSFPGGAERTFLLKTADAKAGKPATVCHFAGTLGHPVNTQDAMDDLLFVNLTDRDIVIARVAEGPDGAPQVASVTSKPHGFPHFGRPPPSPQKGTDKKTASGDRNPKNLVVQNGSLWFSHAVNVAGRTGVQWHQFKLDGTKVQSGLLAHEANSYIQTSLAVNAAEDVLVGFQETGPDMFISPRCAW